MALSVINMIPNAMSNETARDSEPNIAVDLSNPLRIAASAFTPDPMSSGTAPIWLSTDGGDNWVLSVCVPGGAPGSDTGGGNSRTGDITLRFATTSGVLYAGILRKDNGNLELLRKADFTLPGAMTSLVNRAGDDQPWVEAASVLGGGATGRDRVYVGHNETDAPGGKTATSETSLDAATAPGPAGLVAQRLEPRSTCSQDGPSVRPAIHPDGTIYAAYFRWTACLTAPFVGDVVVARDDGWASGATPFASLVDPDAAAGRKVAVGVSFPWMAMLGTQRIGSQLAIAVDPRNSSTVYIAWCDGTTASNYTVRVRRSIDRGVNWTSDLRAIVQATNPALAINSRGKVGLLYQQLGNPGSGNRWRTHFETTSDGFASAPTDLIVADVPDQNGPYTGQNPIGDYSNLVAAGKNFYGIFSANNTPSMANFPQGVTYARNANFATGQLLDASSNPVSVSIDPFLLRSIEVAREDDFYVRDWTDSATRGDNGLEPSTHPQFYTTSDVWNRRGTLPGSFPSDQPSNEPAGNGASTVGDNWAFARIRRNAPAASGTKSVTAHFLVSKFGVGSNYTDAGTVDPDLSFPDPDPVVMFNPADIGPFVTPAYHWHLNAISSTHLCLAVEISAAGDPFVPPSLVGRAPGWPTTDLMVINDNNTAQRNMGLSTTPARGVGLSDTYYALIHNASVDTRDVRLRWDAPDRTTARLKGATIEVIGGRNQPLRPSSTVVLKGMQPGENRWVGLTFPAPKGTSGEVVAVHVSEMVGNAAVNGFAIAAAPGPMSKVIRERLELHRSVFTRIAASFELPHEVAEVRAVQRVLDQKTTSPKQYTAFLVARLPAIAETLKALLATHADAGDPFGATRGLTSLRNAAADGDDAAMAVTHSAFLNKLDAHLTMRQLEDGDVADILQNVRWQLSLYTTVASLARLDSAQAVVEFSERFIAGFETREIGNAAFPELIEHTLEAFRETAKAAARKQPAVKQRLESLEKALGEDLATLQREHRGWLLELHALAG
ncbi:MAG: LysR family transcriptional regulator [Mycobacteriales bacterium]